MGISFDEFLRNKREIEYFKTMVRLVSKIFSLLGEHIDSNCLQALEFSKNVAVECEPDEMLAIGSAVLQLLEGNQADRD